MVLRGFFSDNEQDAVTLPHSAQKRKKIGKNKRKVKITKEIPKKKVSLEFLHQRLGHRSTRSLLAGYVDFFW